MRNIGLLLIILIITSCANKKEKDYSQLNQLNYKTDSLIEKLQYNFDQKSTQLYTLADDSLRRDSLVLLVNLPDTMGIYEFIEKTLSQLDELIFQTKQEIYFAKDQINSVKMEYSKSEISDNDYMDEIESLEVLVHFLEERVDSSLYFIQSNEFFNAVLNDSLP